MSKKEGLKKHVYDFLKAQSGEAWTAGEISKRIDIPVGRAEIALEELAKEERILRKVVQKENEVKEKHYLKRRCDVYDGDEKCKEHGKYQNVNSGFYCCEKHKKGKKVRKMLPYDEHIYYAMKREEKNGD